MVTLRSAAATLTLAAVALAPTVAPVAPGSHAAATRARPDLRVTAVSAPGHTRQAGTLRVSVTVRNAGAAPAGASTTTVYLSRDRRVGRDARLAPRVAVGRLRAGRSQRRSVTVAVPRSIAVGSYRLLACADTGRRVRERYEGNNCRFGPVVRVTRALTGHELIQAEVDAGRLTPEQGLVYRVYSDFRDPRLPRRFVAPPGGLEDGSLAEVPARWSTLSARARSTLGPFLVPPFYRGSHWSPAPAGAAPLRFAAADPDPSGQPWCGAVDDGLPIAQDWSHLDAAGGAVRLWWRTSRSADAATAAQLAAAVEKFLLPMQALVSTTLKSDDDVACDGGSAAYDVALVEGASTASTLTETTVACADAGTASHTVLPRTAAQAGWAGLAPYLAHETMHTLLFAMPHEGGCSSHRWLREATAEWVQDWVSDPLYGIGVGPDDTEFAAAPKLLDVPQVSLEKRSPTSHDYGAYLLVFWAARTHGIDFVRRLWPAAAGNADSLAAVDSALPGGFRLNWADFTRANLNDGPEVDYRNWDGLTAAAKVAGTIGLAAGAPRTLDVPVDHLAAKYLDVEVEDGVSAVEVTNDRFDDPDARVEAVISYSDGSHDVVELTQEKTVLCLDDGARRATRVTLVLSNAAVDDDTRFQPTLEALAVCGCPAATPPGARGSARAATASCGYSGNLSFTYTDDYSDADGNYHETTSGTLRLEMVQDPDDPDQYSSGPGSSYSVTSQWHRESYAHEIDGCRDTAADRSQSGSGSIEDGQMLGSIYRPSGEFWLVNIVALPTTYQYSSSQACVGPYTDSGEDFMSLPQCPPQPGSLDPWYEYAPPSQPGGAFTFSCSGTAVVQNGTGDGRPHTVSVEVTGTLVLTD